MKSKTAATRAISGHSDSMLFVECNSSFSKNDLQSTVFLREQELIKLNFFPIFMNNNVPVFIFSFAHATKNY